MRITSTVGHRITLHDKVSGDRIDEVLIEAGVEVYTVGGKEAERCTPASTGRTRANKCISLAWSA